MCVPRVLWVLPVVAVASCVSRHTSVQTPRAQEVTALSLAGHVSIPPLQRIPSPNGLPFGGISGIVAGSDGNAILGVSDARDGYRVYSFVLAGHGDALSIVPVATTPLESADSTLRFDLEGIAITRDGTLLVASEGIGNVEPRIPPAILEYGRPGNFIRRLDVRPRYLQNPTGSLNSGVRPNMGFESLTIAPDGSRFFTATESALVQDGPMATFDAGAHVRLLEYAASDGTYVPRREWVYPLEPVLRPPFQTDLAINGLVELLALGHTQLLALERCYVRETGGTGRDAHRIRIFRIDLDGATDVSGVDSLKDATGVVAVRKSLVLDLSELESTGIELDNFEGLAFGPTLPDGRPSLIVVSDDNFSAFDPPQVNQFILFELNTP